MKRLLALAITAVLLLASCTTGGGTSSGGGGDKPTTPVEYRSIYSTELTTLNYLKSSTNTIEHSAYLTVDSLIDFDEYGVTIPCLATEWKVSDDGLVYTYKLREGVNWQTVKGDVYAEVVAQDFVDSLKWVLTKENASTTSNLVYDFVKGAKAYYDGTTTDFSTVGVKAIDKYTVEYTLIDPTPYFLKLTSYACYRPANGKFLEEQGEMFASSNDTILYNGAYIMKTFEPENKRVYEKNPAYWGKDQIYIDTITNTYNKEAANIGPALFLRNEIDRVGISTEILDDWMGDPAKKAMVTQTPRSSYSYFLGFNFEPTYEAEYDPENWKIVVNNVNFRKSLVHSIDRVAINMALDPYNPASVISNTITVPDMVNLDGTDFVNLGPLKKYSEGDSFDTKSALEYKTKALEELNGKATFPVKVVMPYNTGSNSHTNRVQILEQQVEKVLGTDYIDIVLVPYPPTNYLTNARSSGKFSFFEMNWGPDYADPATYTDIFMPTPIGEKYNQPYLATENLDASGNSIYVKMVEAAMAEKLDIAKRYQLFAEAEAYLLDNAMVLPLYISGKTYEASRIDQFSGYNSMFGRNIDKLKGKRMLEKPYTEEEFKAAQAKYDEARAKAQAAAAK